MNVKSVDVVQIEVIRHALVAAAEEMSITIWRTSRSTVVRDLLDFSTCMFDAEGKSVAQAACIPIHLNSMSSCLEDILRNHIPIQEWRERDIIITNDPYAGGQHLSDIMTFKPAFADGRLIGIAGVLVHHLDVGGGAPGSYFPGATEIYNEGFCIPPLYLDREGHRNEEVIKLLLRNSREPVNVGGDLASQLAALEIGVAGLQRIAKRYGIARLSEACRIIRSQSEAALRAAIKALPNGRYTFEDFVDDDGIEINKMLKIDVILTVSNDTVEVDLSGSSPQSLGPVNCTRNMSSSAVFCALLVAIGNDIPANAGCYVPVNVITPEGLCINARSPAPVANRMAVAHRVVNAVMGALSKAVPERIPAAYYGVSYNYGLNLFHADGRRQVYFDATVGGWGGHPEGDGADGFSCGLHNFANEPIEVLEGAYPITFEAYRLLPNSGGQGKFRGGCGLTRSFRIDAPAGTLTCNFDRFKTRPYGLAGGLPGSAGYAELRRADGSAEPLPSKVSNLRVGKGDLFTLMTSGGGGYGDPAQRDQEAIGRDRSNGYVS